MNWNKYVLSNTSTKTVVMLERDGISFKAEIPWDSDIDTVMNSFMALMIGMGYVKEGIDDWIIESSELIIKENDRATDSE